MIAFPEKKYGVIYADPAWDHKTFSPKGLTGRPQHYPRMSVEEIAALPVRDIAAKDCHLFLWITGPHFVLGSHLPLLKAWGFKPSAIAFTWIKLRKKAASLFVVGEDLIQRHHALMLAQDIDAAMELRREAHDLAYVLNGFTPGILAGPEAAGCRLENSTLAPFNTVPLWGQQGQFPLLQFNALVDVDGIFGVGATTCAGMGFSVNCIDRSKPFLSETGYRSFLGYSAPVPLGTQIDGFVSACIEQHIAKELKGKLKAVDSQWGKPRLPALNP